MRSIIKAGDDIPLSVILGNGATDKYVVADLYHYRTGAVVASGVELTHVANGFYRDASQEMPSHDVITVYRIFESDESTPSTDTETRSGWIFQLDPDLSADLAALEAKVDIVDGNVDDIETELAAVALDVSKAIRSGVGVIGVVSRNKTVVGLVEKE